MPACGIFAARAGLSVLAAKDPTPLAVVSVQEPDGGATWAELDERA